jgi:hypothetical protein
MSAVLGFNARRLFGDDRLEAVETSDVFDFGTRDCLTADSDGLSRIACSPVTVAVAVRCNIVRCWRWPTRPEFRRLFPDTFGDSLADEMAAPLDAIFSALDGAAEILGRQPRINRADLRVLSWPRRLSFS